MELLQSNQSELSKKIARIIDFLAKVEIGLSKDYLGSKILNISFASMIIDGDNPYRFIPYSTESSNREELIEIFCKFLNLCAVLIILDPSFFLTYEETSVASRSIFKGKKEVERNIVERFKFIGEHINSVGINIELDDFKGIEDFDYWFSEFTFDFWEDTDSEISKYKLQYLENMFFIIRNERLNLQASSGKQWLVVRGEMTAARTIDTFDALKERIEVLKQAVKNGGEIDNDEYFQLLEEVYQKFDKGIYDLWKQKYPDKQFREILPEIGFSRLDFFDGYLESIISFVQDKR